MHGSARRRKMAGRRKMIFDLRGKVIKEEFINSKIKFVRIEPLEDFAFKSGQFVNIEVAPQFYRSYSIASSGLTPGVLEFIIDITPGGKGSLYFEKLTVGDDVHMKGPFGILTLPTDLNQKFCFVATGTGVAPFRSMTSELAGKNVSLFWGLRYKEDIFFEEEFKNLSRFCISLSRPENWNGKTGHITECLKEEKFDTNTLFYLCGNNQMIEDAKKILTEKGVGKDKIKLEKFY